MNLLTTLLSLSLTLSPLTLALPAADADAAAVPTPLIARSPLAAALSEPTPLADIVADVAAPETTPGLPLSIAARDGGCQGGSGTTVTGSDGIVSQNFAGITCSAGNTGGNTGGNSVSQGGSGGSSSQNAAVQKGVSRGGMWVMVGLGAVAAVGVAL